LATRSESAEEIPSSESLGAVVNPWAMSCELRYWRFGVDANEEVDASENGEPNSDTDTSKAQWTSFFASAMLGGGVGTRRDGVTWIL